MSRNRGRRTELSAPDDARAASPLGRWLEVAVSTLVVLRLLEPPEGSVIGRTLWITQLWFAAGLLAVWQRLREPALRRPFDMLDAGMLTLVAAHVVAALRVVVWHDGNRRLAINMLWEWLALGISFVLLRQILQSADAARRAAWQRLFVALAVAMAGLGVWQHYIGNRALAREYTERREELDRLQSTRSQPGENSVARADRLRELQAWFAAQQIPMEGGARRLYEDRLRESREPIGLFALTNTLAGWMGVWFLVGAGLTLRNRVETADDRRKFVRWLPVVLLALVAFCLVLTKSRTAWVGLMAGLAAWGALSWRGTRDPAMRRRFAWAAGGGLAVAILLVAAAAFSGGLDREVVAQAPRSLKFRLQYWSGAARVVRDHWLLGTGPGNFRPHYLRHKLPEASEEILDPHNFFFDLWTSAGLLGVIGFGLAIAGAVRAASPRRSPGSNGSTTPPLERFSPAELGGILAFTMSAGADLLLTGDTSDALRLLAVAAAWLAALLMLRKAGLVLPAAQACLAGAAAALMVHLLGAGGIEMPAIVQCLVLLALFVEKEAATTPQSAAFPSVGRNVAAAGFLFLLFAGCLLTATRPVLSREAQLTIGDAEYSRSGTSGSARRHYEEAAAADPFAPEPLQRLSEVLFAEWSQRRTEDGKAFDSAVRLGALAQELDPHNPHAPYRIGQMWLARFERNHAPEAASEAVRWLTRAAEQYPTLAVLRAERAVAFEAAGKRETARDEARTALDLDAVSHREQHADRYLEEPLRKRLEALAR